AEAGGTPERPGSWLILADAGGTGARLAERLQAAGEHCLIAVAGAGSGPNGSLRHLQPGDTGAWARLVREAGAGHGPLRGVVPLWGAEDSSQVVSLESIQRTQQVACQSLLHVVHALARQATPTTPRLWVITQATQPVGEGAPPVSPAASTLWGLGRSIAQEHPELWGGLIDLCAGSVGGELDAAVAEIRSGDGEDHVAFRNGQRYVARLVPAARRAKGSKPLRLRVEGTHLITGGLGGLGLAVARWLVERGVR